METTEAEALQERMDRLRWACQRTRSELNAPLSRFLDHYYPNLNMAERFAFERLLSAPDTQIADWLANHSQSPDQGVCRIVEVMKKTG